MFNKSWLVSSLFFLFFAQHVNAIDINDIPLLKSAHVFEVERGTPLGVATTYTDQSAFNLGGIAYIFQPGAGFRLDNVPESRYIALRYATIFDGTISLFINGEFRESLNFEKSGAWVVNYNFAIFEVDIPADATFEIIFNTGDAAINVDQVLFASNKLQLIGTIQSEMFMDSIANGMSNGPIGTKNSDDNYTHISENNDDFDTEELNWNILNPQKLNSSSIENGQLVVRTAPFNAWLNKARGAHIHKLIHEDNFSVTSRVKISRPDGSDITTTEYPWMQAGIVLRKDGNSLKPKNNFYLGSIGVDVLPEVVAEYKTTVDDISIWTFTDWGHDESEIRICRYDNNITLIMRPIGGEWVEINSTYRDDLAGPLYVGPMTFAHNDQADILAKFDYVHFDELDSAEACYND